MPGAYKYKFPFGGALAKLNAGSAARLKMLKFPTGTPVMAKQAKDPRSIRVKYPHLDLKGARAKFGLGG